MSSTRNTKVGANADAATVYKFFCAPIVLLAGSGCNLSSISRVRLSFRFQNENHCWMFQLKRQRAPILVHVVGRCNITQVSTPTHATNVDVGSATV